jgi:hypothetical protein
MDDFRDSDNSEDALDLENPGIFVESDGDNSLVRIRKNQK